MLRAAALLLAVGAASSGASAAFVSFASDTNPAAPTFDASFNAATQITTLNDRGTTTVLLEIDPDEDGPGGPITINAALDATLELVYSGSVLIAPGFYTHTFAVSGSFSFRDANTDALLFSVDTAAGDAAFAGFGNGVRITTGAISGFGAEYTIGAAGAGAVGFGGVVLGDFGFTLTAINGGAGANLVFDGQNIVGLANFTSESSFSGSFVPAPGAAALFGLASLVAMRRRR